MSGKLIEGNLLFEFGSRWTNVFHWDRHAAFLGGMHKANQGKAVDFVGVLENRIPFLFEVKDYRDVTRAREKIVIEHEFELKVRSTVAALFGTRFDDTSDSGRSFESLREARQPRVVLWHEDIVSDQIALITLQDKIAYNLSWLRPDPLVTNTRFKSGIPDLAVRALPVDRQERIDEIIDILLKRGKPVPPELRWKIDGVLEVGELDRLIVRAKTVKEGWNLFR